MSISSRTFNKHSHISYNNEALFLIKINTTLFQNYLKKIKLKSYYDQWMINGIIYLHMWQEHVFLVFKISK